LLRRATGAAGRSFLAAGLFALHPFNVESVVWIAERKNVLSTFFLLLTLAAYGWYACKPQIRRYLVVAALFALGLAAKPMLVTLPFALLLLDYWPLRRVEGWIEGPKQLPVIQAPPAQLIKEKLPLLALSVVSAVLTIMAQRNAEKDLTIFPFAARLANASASYALYLWKTFVPASFAVFYPQPFEALVVPPGAAVKGAVVAGAVLLIAVSLLAWRTRWTQPYLATGWFWYLGTLVPVIGIVQVGGQGMADRYAYVPLIGIFVITAWGGADLAERLHLATSWRQALTAVVLVILAGLSFRQLGYWKTDFELWSHTLQVTRDNYRADRKIGDLLAAQQRPDAVQYYEAAAKIAPWDPETRVALAGYFQDRGQLKEAIQNYELVIRSAPDQHPHQTTFAYINLCMIFGKLGDLDRAHEAFRQALRIYPRGVDLIIHNLSLVVAVRPSDYGYLGLGLLLEQSGQLPAARDAYRQALALNPEQPQAWQALMRLASENGSGDNAARSN